jgi:predicted nuclease of predicted toxin-antitoxin system
MLAFLIDEDLPRGLAVRLRTAGFDAIDVRDVALQATADAVIYPYAVAHRLAILTADLGFSNLVRFPLEEHHGIVVARFPNAIPAPSLSRMLTEAINALGLDSLGQTVVIIEPGRTRIRRHM